MRCNRVIYSTGNSFERLGLKFMGYVEETFIPFMWTRLVSEFNVIHFIAQLKLN